MEGMRIAGELFDESSEIVYKTEGMAAFHSAENERQDEPMGDGPYATLIRKLSRLQERLPFSVELSPIRIAIVTSRNSPAEIRVINTLRKWGVYVNEIFFLGGVEKTKILKVFKPHIFFDDQDLHLDPAAKHIPSGKVPYRSESPLNKKDYGANSKLIIHSSGRLRRRLTQMFYIILRGGAIDEYPIP